MTFASDVFMVYDQFTARRVNHNESVDAYLVIVWMLVVLLERVNERIFMHAFVSGSCQYRLSTFFWDSPWMDQLSIDQILAQARAILKDVTVELTTFVAATQATRSKSPKNSVGPHTDVISYTFNGLTHLVCDCFSRQTKDRLHAVGPGREMRSFRC